MTISGTAPPPCSPRSACSTAPSLAAACSVTATSSSFAFSMPPSAPSRPTSQSTLSSTTTPPTNTQGAGLVGAPSTLDLPLHSDLGLLAQRCRDFLLKDDATAHPPRRLPLDRRSAGRHQC